MCGIIGIIGQTTVCAEILESLARLTYRGYDSAGVAVLSEGQFKRVRASGKLESLRQALAQTPVDGPLGIGHTRWATHGEPSEQNAHPHVSERVAVVHNGIIENFQSLRDRLKEKGHIFETQTDTEVVVHCLEEALLQGKTPFQATRDMCQELKGAFSLVLMFKEHPNLMMGVRQGAPMAVGYGDGRMFLGSDAMALASLTQRVTYLEDGDIAVLSLEGGEIYGRDGNLIVRSIVPLESQLYLAQKGSHRHFMHKEIFEQPEAMSHALGDWIDLSDWSFVQDDVFGFARLKKLSIAACGTAFYAGLMARYWFERYAHVPVDLDVASEFRYREPPLDPEDFSMVISQSGETADTLAALRYCQSQKQSVLALTNVSESTMAREATYALRICAGPEIGVASTKAFTCQLAVLACLSLLAGLKRGVLSLDEIKKYMQDLVEAPRCISSVLLCEEEMRDIARQLSQRQNVLYVGRGTGYVLALEGALKLKELSYIHAEGYAAGELKHGAIALLDENMPVVVVAPRDRWLEKTLSNMEEILARGAPVLLIADAAVIARYRLRVWKALIMPDIGEIAAPLVYAVPLQLLAYHAAVHLGTDVDQPRNLAKSVTVE